MRGFGDMDSDEEAAYDEQQSISLGYGNSSDGNPAIFKDSDGNTYSREELDALGEGDTQGWSAQDFQDKVDEVNSENDAAAALGTSAADVKKQDAAAASGGWFDTIFSVIGKSGAAGIAYLRAHPNALDSIPGGSALTQYIPGYGAPRTSTGKPTATSISNTTLLIAGGAVLVGVAIWKLKR
jgi:hypothetical protein